MPGLLSWLLLSRFGEHTERCRKPSEEKKISCGALSEPWRVRAEPEPPGSVFVSMLQVSEQEISFSVVIAGLARQLSPACDHMRFWLP